MRIQIKEIANAMQEISLEEAVSTSVTTRVSEFMRMTVQLTYYSLHPPNARFKELDVITSDHRENLV